VPKFKRVQINCPYCNAWIWRDDYSSSYAGYTFKCPVCRAFLYWNPKSPERIDIWREPKP